MSHNTIKQDIHKLIDSIDDEELLNVLKEDIVAYTTSSDADMDELTPEQLKKLDEAIGEADRGETINWEDLKKQMAEWRSK